MNEEELSDRQLDWIERIVWIVFTSVVILSIWFPYVAVVLLFAKWTHSMVQNNVWKADRDAE